MDAERYHLAQANYSFWKRDVRPEYVQQFIDQLDEVNLLAESWPGFVWRYISGPGDPLVTAAFSSERAIFNMSVWNSVGQLKDFAFRGRHGGIMKQKAVWFDRLPGVTSILWWVPAGYRPTVAEAKGKIDLINEQGASRDVFTFARMFDPD